NVPAQHVIQTALGGYQSINDLILPGGRLVEQRNLATKLLRNIPGVSVQEAHGALYLFPRLDPEMYPIEDDETFVIDLLRQQQILVSHGGAFNYPDTDHFRMVTLPPVRELSEGIERIAAFLDDYRYRHAYAGRRRAQPIGQAVAVFLFQHGPRPVLCGRPPTRLHSGAPMLHRVPTAPVTLRVRRRRLLNAPRSG